ncbi:MAG: BtrH N-terminal domain-containing protein [Promethearchaeota archaeon]
MLNTSKNHTIEGFKHKIGKHCESSSMRDIFEFNGFPMTEAMAFGLDASLGFVYFNRTTNPEDMEDMTDNAPFFFGGKQGTIESTSIACRILGLNVRKQSFTNADKAWIETKKLINDEIPLILKVDLAYLPYFRFEGVQVHFGGHAITLAGYDEDKRIALVGESDREGFQEVPIENLKTARSSTYGPKFMRPNNTQFSMSTRQDGKLPPFAAGVKLAIKQCVDNMLRPSLNNFGIQGLKLFARSIPDWKDSLQGQVKDSNGNLLSIARLMFEFAHGYIETWGTGGALFRNLYKEFLEELLVTPELNEGPKAWNSNDFDYLKKGVSIISESVELWNRISGMLETTVKENRNNCLENMDLLEFQGIIDSIASKEEELFRNLLHIKI